MKVGLNIKSVNNESEWLTNFSYTDTILEGIENNSDIIDPEQLKRWGERKLKDLCKPRKDLTVKAVLLYQLEEYELEKIALNDIVDVINFANISGDIEQLRVVGYEYGVWDYSDAIIDLSDITLESTDIFKKTVSASNSINNGTLNTSKIVSFFKNGQSLSTTLKEIDRTIVDTKTELYKTDEAIGAKITEVVSDVNTLSNEVVNQKTTIENLELTINGLINELTQTGGNNLLRNSVGFFGNEYWEGTVEQYSTTNVQQNNESKSSMRLKTTGLLQKVTNLKSGEYTVSFNYRKLLSNATVNVIINGETTALTAYNVWTPFEKTIKITNFVLSEYCFFICLLSSIIY